MGGKAGGREQKAGVREGKDGGRGDLRTGQTGQLPRAPLFGGPPRFDSFVFFHTQI